MGRKFPVGETNAINHPFISVTLFIACVVATITIISSLCGSLSRKKSEPSSDDQPNEIKDGNIVSLSDETQNDQTSKASAGTGTGAEAGNEMDVIASSTQNDDEFGLGQQPLPPPPGRRHLSGTASCHFRSNSTASNPSTLQTKLPASRSMRVFGNGTSRQASKREDNINNIDRKKDKKLKHEDSVWKKTIILGEKCKVPEEDDDTILYDEKGNRISTYHPKNNSKPLSRQNSNVDQDSIPRL
ncbi:hypothetical protein M9H77_19534 [Catharanthus roseus]|uniref:Uncharacterized protein n=1 Tax=Catharanthus roseus TaxID=4058 RepID=A0ACC0BAL5_CATRO|nr:hypothetical protein M9H77_19534 [Catharanthus roseus]